MENKDNRPSWIVTDLSAFDPQRGYSLGAAYESKPQESLQQPIEPNAGTLKYFMANDIDLERIKAECNGLYDQLVTTLNCFFQERGISGSELERELAQISLSSIGLPEELRLLVEKTIYGISHIGPIAKPRSEIKQEAGKSKPQLIQAQRLRKVPKVYV